MRSLFNPDNPVFAFINLLLDLLLLSIFWTLGCIPIITAGASSAALYHAVVMALRKEQGYAWKTFLTAFRQNLKKGILFHLVFLFFAAMLLVGDMPWILQAFAGTRPSVFSLFLFIVKTFFLLGWVCWIYPLISRFDERFLKLAEAALFQTVRNLLITILSIILLLIAGFLLWLEPLLLLIAPAPVALGLSYLLEPGLKQLDGQQDNSAN